MSLIYFFNSFITKNQLLPSPSIFFFQITEKKKTKIRNMRSTKRNKRRNNIADVPQELSRQRELRKSLLTPYRLIYEQDTYNDSYDVFVQVYEYGCNLQFQTAQEPYVDRYFVCFNDYIRDENGYSEEQNKQLVMNLGDVLLAVDGVDIAGKSLKDVKCLILYKHQQMVRLTFLNENWFNKFERISVRVADDIPKNRCVENGFVDLYFRIHETGFSSKCHTTTIFPSCISFELHQETDNDIPEPPCDNDSGKGAKLLQ